MKIAKYIPAAALALVLAGCQSEDDFISSDYANDPMAVHIRAGIEALQTRVNTTGTGNAWDENDQISVTNTSPEAITGKDKAVYKYNGSTWVPEGTDYIVWSDDVENTFEAYYPVVEGKTDSYTQFELPTDQNSSDPDDDNYIGRADYMTAAASQSKSDALNLTFKHHLTKVTVKISGYGDQYETVKPTFQDPTFTVPTTTTTVDGKTLTVAGNGTTVTGLFSEDASAEAKHSFTAVLLPGKYAADDTFVQLNIQGGTPFIVKANVQQLTTGLESGKAYTFNVTVGKNGATINSVTVGDWGTDGWTQSGTADEETGPKVNADTHTISLSDVGQLNTELIGQALNGETTNVPLTISGPMNENDIAALKKYMTNNTDATLSLDLKGAKLASIPAQAFVQITGLVSIKLPEGLKVIGDSWNGSTFSECTALQSVEFPSTLEELNFSSFWGCTSLETIDLSKTKVASIEAALFRNCSSLTSVSFGPETSVFNNTVFVGCSSLTTIDLSLCEAVPAFDYTPGDDSESPFYDLEKSKITIYVKDAEMKTKFESSEWVTRVGFTADNFKVKNNQ